MPSIKDLWPDRWLKPAILQGRTVIVAIETVSVEELFNPRTNRTEPRLILKFHNKQLRLIVNKTQAESIAAITGTDDFTLWIGHTVALAPTKAKTGADTIAILPAPNRTNDVASVAAHVGKRANELAQDAAIHDMLGDDDDPDPVTTGDFR